MITQYFDINQRLIIQAPGTLAPATSTPWVYGDNYNLAIYLVANGIFQPININDSLGLLLFQPGGALPEGNLAIISAPTILTDPSGFQYYLINVNLKVQELANLVQTANKPVQLQFHYTFTPGDGERFSSSADLAVTVNPDPTEGATGGTPVPPGYPSNPNVFELIAHKGIANGYASLDATGKIPAAQISTGALGGDMLKSVYDTDNDGIVDTCDSLSSSKVTGLGTAALLNTPATGVNAASGQVVKGDDTRLTDTRTPTAHGASHLTTDAIPEATTSSHGLCPTVDGATIQIVSGKLVATTTGSGDMLKSVYDTGSLGNSNAVDNARTVQTHQIPAAGDATGSQLVLASDSRLTNARTPSAHAATHTGGTDAIPLVTPTAMGLCPPVDNTSISVASGKLAGILATSLAPGIVKPDGTTIAIAAGTISVPFATTANAGIAKPDNTSITVGSNGILTAIPQGINVNVRVNQSSAQALSPTASTPTAINWGAADFQNGGTFWTISPNPSRLTVPAGQGGMYCIGGNLLFTVNATGSQRQISLRRTGGGSIVFCNTVTGGAAGTWAPSACVSIIQQLIAGDYIEMFAAADVASLNTAPGNGPCNLWMFRIA